jgi:amidohydrolase
MKNALLDYVNEQNIGIRKTWDELHRIPELGFKEKRTSSYLLERLKNAGYSVKSGLAQTGIISVLRSDNPGPTVGLRADMDALCHEVDGRKAVIHSCGHDANCTMVLTAAEAIAACGGPKRGTLKIIFQPAEETLDGAKEIIKTGEIGNLDYLVGIHLRPKEELSFGQVTPSIRHGASGIMKAKIKGVQAHGARPHQGVNAVEAAAYAILGVNQIKLNPQIPHSIKATMIKGGNGAFNVIPDSVNLAFDLRAQTNLLMEELKKKAVHMLEIAADSISAQIDVKWKGGVPAAQDSDELIELANEAIWQVLGPTGLQKPLITSGGEDFHQYALAIKDLKTTVIGVGADLSPGLHHPEMTFNLDALSIGTKVLILMLNKLLI